MGCWAKLGDFQFQLLRMADEEKQQQTPLHVVMFPWLAHGHISPFLQLAKELDANGLTISFVSTPLNLARIQQQILQTRIQLVELPMPAVDGLPTGVESSADLSKIGGGLMPLLFQAIDRLEKPLEALLKLLSPDFVILDIIQYSAPRIAAQLNIPTITFMVMSAASMSFLQGAQQSLKAEDLSVPPPGFPSSVVRRRLFEARKALQFSTAVNEGPTFLHRLHICVEESWAIAFNTCAELEGPYLDYFQTITGRPVFPVGILMPDLPPRPSTDRCLEWLDGHPPRSIVLASFGMVLVVPIIFI